MTNPKSVGDRSEAMVLAALLLAGRPVLQPFGDNSRYDLVFEDSDGFKRVQCKTGRIIEGTIRFNTCSVDGRPGGARKNYRGQVEFFGVYCKDNGNVYLVPVGEVPLTEGALRIEPTRNKQASKVRWAKDFEIKTTVGG